MYIKESNKSCKNCKNDEECAGNDSGIFPCPYYEELTHENVMEEKIMVTD